MDEEIDLPNPIHRSNEDWIAGFKYYLLPHLPEIRGQEGVIEIFAIDLASNWRQQTREPMFRPDKRAQIEKLESALNNIRKLDLAFLRFQFQKHRRHGLTDPEIEEMLMVLALLNHHGGRYNSLTINATIDKFMDFARSEIARHGDAKAINWDAVFAVDALIGLWVRIDQKRNAPQSLKSGSELEEFIEHGLQLLNVEANARAAFRAWRAHKIE